MVRYTQEHKEETRQRILETARHEFRRRGFESASIDTLMRAAGLTRGGFYAHFPSKEALVEQVLGIEAGLLRSLRTVPDGPEKRAMAAAALQSYLEPGDTEDLIDCPYVAHPLDAARGGERRAELYEQQLTELVGAIGSSAEVAEEESVVLAILAVGAAILSRGVDDRDTAQAIRQAARSEIERRLSGDESVT